MNKAARAPIGAWARRRPERHWLGLCLFSVTLGFMLVLGTDRGFERPLAARDWLPLGLYALSLLVLHGTLVAARFRGDQALVAAVALLSGVGLLVQYRMGAFAQADWRDWALYPAGTLAMLGTLLLGMRGRYQWLARAGWFWALVSLLILAVLLATGQRFRGAVYAAGLITPSEGLKITVALFLAAFVAARAKALANWPRAWLPPLRPLLPLMVVWLALCALLALQRDLGMLLILNIGLLIVLPLGSGRPGYLMYAGGAALGGGYLLLNVFSHGARRLQAWRDPFADPTGASWQLLQGLSGMYSGGLWGQGFGAGDPQYIPIAASDFIYAVLSEELGFVGSAVILAMFLIAFHRGFVIAARAGILFGRLLAAVLTGAIAAQTFLNIAGVTKFLPLTGITLPFISHGGSSLLATFIASGLLLAISDGEPAGPGRTRARAATPARPRDSRRPKAKPDL